MLQNIESLAGFCAAKSKNNDLEKAKIWFSNLLLHSAENLNKDQDTGLSNYKDYITTDDDRFLSLAENSFKG